MCEQDTVSIQVTKVSSLVLEFAICILHLMHPSVPAGMGEFEPKLLELSGVEVVEEQHAWYIVCGGVCESRIR